MRQLLPSPGFRACLLGAALLAASLLAGAAPTCPPEPRALTAEELQARPPADRGLLWRISRAGRSAYLYGSIHVGKPGWSHPGPRLSAALQDSDSLALELDPGDPALAQELAAALAARPLAPDPALQPRLERQRAAACLPPEPFADLHPLMQALTLSVLAARWEGMDPAFGQEQALAGQARARRWPVFSLETAAQQVEALLPADAGQARRMTAELLTQLEQGSARRVLRRLGQAWERGDLEQLARYESWCGCADSPEDRDFLRRVNDARNPGLADGIAALHAQGHRLFIAVGALHMTGPQGLLGLLAQRGFTVERLPLRR